MKKRAPCVMNVDSRVLDVSLRRSERAFRVRIPASPLLLNDPLARSRYALVSPRAVGEAEETDHVLSSANALYPQAALIGEEVLAEGAATRQLVAILMAEDWLGLRVLYEIRSQQAAQTNVNDLGAAFDRDADILTGVLGRFVDVGLVTIVKDSLVLSVKGTEILRQIDRQLP